jgi:hypothetical protein
LALAEKVKVEQRTSEEQVEIEAKVEEEEGARMRSARCKAAVPDDSAAA